MTVRLGTESRAEVVVLASVPTGQTCPHPIRPEAIAITHRERTEDGDLLAISRPVDEYIRREFSHAPRPQVERRVT